MKMNCAAVFTLPYDEPTPNGEQAAWRWHVPVGTDSRRIRRETRKILQALGVNRPDRAIRELGWRKYCGL